MKRLKELQQTLLNAECVSEMTMDKWDEWIEKGKGTVFEYEINPFC